MTCGQLITAESWNLAKYTKPVSLGDVLLSSCSLFILNPADSPTPAASHQTRLVLLVFQALDYGSTLSRVYPTPGAAGPWFRSFLTSFTWSYGISERIETGHIIFWFLFFFFCVLVWFVSVPGVLHVEAYALSASCILPCLGIREGRKFNRLSALNGLPLLPD